MKTTININGTDFTIDQLNSIIEAAKKANPMDEVFKYHNIKEEDFNSKWEGFEAYEIAQAKEILIASYYNKNKKPDWTDSSQYKYCPYFVMDKNKFRCYDYVSWSSHSYVSARLCFLRKEDMLEAVEKFIDIYKESRTY